MNVRQYANQVIAYIAETSVYIKKYVAHRLALLKLDATEKLIKLFSIVSHVLIVGFFVLLAFVFLFFSLAFWLSDLLGSDGLGFLAVGLLALLLALISLRSGGKWIQGRMERLVTELFFEESDDDEA